MFMVLLPHPFSLYRQCAASSLSMALLSLKLCLLSRYRGIQRRFTRREVAVEMNSIATVKLEILNRNNTKPRY